MGLSGTTNDFSFPALDINLDGMNTEEEVSLNAALGDQDKQGTASNSKQAEDAFARLDPGTRVTEMKPQGTRSNILDSDLFGTSRGEGEFDYSTKEGREAYNKELGETFGQALEDAIEDRNQEAIQEINNQIREKIEEDIENGRIYNTDAPSQSDDIEVSSGPEGAEPGGALSSEDFRQAAEDAEKAQADQLQKLIDKASKAGQGSSEGGFNADDLIRQARIDKWEALKDQQMVYYLKATLAGIKASQTLSKSVQTA